MCPVSPLAIGGWVAYHHGGENVAATLRASVKPDAFRVLVIEDHALVREAMVLALDRLGRNSEILQAACGQEALQIVENDAGLDLVLVDLLLPDMSGFSLVSVLKHRFPALPVVVVSALADEASVKRAIKAGATSFLSKSISVDQLMDAIGCILNGEVVLPVPRQPSGFAPSRRLGLESLADRFGLTAAQTRVMELMVEGRTNKEIADLLGLAEGTVKVHCSAILKALGVANRAQALVIMARHGMLRP